MVLRSFKECPQNYTTLTKLNQCRYIFLLYNLKRFDPNLKKIGFRHYHFVWRVYDRGYQHQ